MGAFKGFHIWITWIMVIKKHYYIACQCTKSKKWYLYGCLSYHSPSRSPAHHQRSPEEQHGMTPPISEGRQCTPQVTRCYHWWTAVHQCPRRSRTVSKGISRPDEPILCVIHHILNRKVHMNRWFLQHKHSVTSVFLFLVLFFFIVNQVLSFLHSIFDICIPNYPLEGLASFK